MSVYVQSEKDESRAKKSFDCLLVAERMCICDGRVPSANKLREAAGVSDALARQVSKESREELTKLVHEGDLTMRCLRLFDRRIEDEISENKIDDRP